jgi:hypothetical protein
MTNKKGKNKRITLVLDALSEINRETKGPATAQDVLHRLLPTNPTLSLKSVAQILLHHNSGGDKETGYFALKTEVKPRPQPEPKPDAVEFPSEVLYQYGISAYQCGEPEEVDLAPRIAKRPDRQVSIFTEEHYHKVKRVEISLDDRNYIEYPDDDYDCFAGSQIPEGWESAAAIQRGPCFIRVTVRKNNSSKGLRYKFHIPNKYIFAFK